MSTPRPYESIKTEVIKVRKVGDSNNWTLGDLCVELIGLSTTSGKDVRGLFKTLSVDADIPKKKLQLSAKISNRIKKDDTLLGWIRHSTLTYSHVREIYAVKDDVELDKIAKDIIAQGLKLYDLREYMKPYRETPEEKEAQKVFCSCGCGEEITEDTTEAYLVKKVSGKEVLFFADITHLTSWCNA